MPPKKSAHGPRHGGQTAKKQPVQTNVVVGQKQIHQSLSPKLKEQYNKIFGNLDQRKYKEVIEICESILQAAPTHCDAMGLKGYALYYLQPKYHDEMKHYLTEQQLQNKAKPLSVQLRSFGLQTIRKATEIANKESHIPYQLLANVSKMNSDYQTQHDNLKIILSLPSHQNNQSFQRELGNNLLILGKYDQAYKQMCEPLVTTGEQEQREMYEMTQIVDNFLGYEAGQINELISSEKFDQIVSHAMQNRNKIERNEQYNSPGSGAHNLALAEENQLTTFKLFYYEIEQKIAKILDSDGELSQEQITSINTYLQHLKATLNDEKLLDKELLYQKVIKLAIRACNIQQHQAHKKAYNNIWSMEHVLGTCVEQQKVEQSTNPTDLEKVFNSEDIQLFEDAFKFLFERNSNDSELFLSYIKIKKLNNSEALDLLSQYKTRQLPIIHNQLKYYLSDDKNSTGLLEFADGVKKLKTGEIVNIVSRTCQINGVDFNSHYDEVLAKVSEADKGCNLAVGMKLLKSRENISELSVSKLFECENGRIKAQKVVNDFVTSLDAYDEERLRQNLARNEDDKNEVALPPVPEFNDKEIEQLIQNKRDQLQVETWLLLQAWKGELDVELELSKVLMCLDVRDRAPNVHYASVLARSGNFRECLKIYQKFVARNNALLYMIEYQELYITLGMLVSSKESEKIVSNTIIDVDNPEQAEIAQKCMKIAMCCQILQFMNDQYYYYEELYNQLGIAKCEKEVSIRSIQAGAKLLLSRPIVSQVVDVLQQVSDELKACCPQDNCPEYVQDILVKLQDKYSDLFIQHCRMDPPDYGRVGDDDFFLTAFIKQLATHAKVNVPKYVGQLIRRATPYNASPLQINFTGK